jgi:hypothetical protein
MSTPADDDDAIVSSAFAYWQGHWLNPVAYAEKWYEDNPKSFWRFSYELEKRAKKGHG